jgi:predicted nucleic acid-binding Zn finger protein
MTVAARIRRVFAIPLAVALLAAGLFIAPGAAPASAMGAGSFSRAALTKMITQELKKHHQPAPGSNSYLTSYAQAWANKLAKSGSNSVGAPTAEIPPDANGEQVAVAVTQCRDNRQFIGKTEFLLGASFCISNGYFLNNGGFDTTHVGVGYVLTAKKFTMVVVYADYYQDVARKLTAAQPSIKGAVRVGSTVTAQRGSWKPVSSQNTFTYAWTVAGEWVGSESSYLIRPQDKGKRIILEVTGSRPGFWVPGGTRIVRSAPVAAGALIPANPVVTGSRNVGSTLSVASPAWGPGAVALSYEWLRSGRVIPGQNQETYQQTTADLGKKIDVRVTGRRDAYATTTRKTAAGTATAAPLLNGSAAVTISGDVTVDKALTAIADNAWTPGTTKVAYQWYVAGKAVPQATNATFVIPGSAAGKAITVRFTGIAPGFANTSVMSAPTDNVGLASFSEWGTATISGTKAKGKTVTAVVSGTFSPKPTSYTYRWFQGDTPIARATKRTYTISSAEIAATLRLEVGAVRQGYATVYLYAPEAVG